MTFIEMCLEVFKRVAKSHDLSKDMDNYNKAIFYRNNFCLFPRSEIEQFIISVRMDNPIVAVIETFIKSINSKIDRLWNLPIENLYIELQGEITNLIMKGALDSIKILNALNEEQTQQLALRFYNCDLTIFDEYKTE